MYKSLYEINKSDEVKETIDVSNQIDVVLYRREHTKWIYKVNNKWTFYYPPKKREIRYLDNRLSVLKGVEPYGLKMYWLDCCLKHYIEISWFKKTVRDKMTILMKYGKSEIINRGIRAIIKTDTDTFKKFSFTLEEITEVVKKNKGVVDTTTKNVWRERMDDA